MGSEQERDQVVAAYAAGTPVAEIERRYGLTQAEVEYLVGGETGAGRRAPGPVVAAALTVLLAGAYQVITALSGDAVDGWFTVAAVGLAVLLYGLVAYGLWQGRRGAQVLAIIGGGLAVLAGFSAMGRGDPGLVGVGVGVVLVALLLAPESSRAWFGR